MSVIWWIPDCLWKWFDKDFCFPPFQLLFIYRHDLLALTFCVILKKSSSIQRRRREEEREKNDISLTICHSTCTDILFLHQLERCRCWLIFFLMTNTYDDDNSSSFPLSLSLFQKPSFLFSRSLNLLDRLFFFE